MVLAKTDVMRSISSPCLFSYTPLMRPYKKKPFRYSPTLFIHENVFLNLLPPLCLHEPAGPVSFYRAGSGFLRHAWAFAASAGAAASPAR